MTASAWSGKSAISRCRRNCARNDRMKTARSRPTWASLASHRGRPAEWLAENAIRLVSLSAIVLVFLLFVFVVREALPVALGKTNSARVGTVISPDQLGTLSDAA